VPVVASSSSFFLPCQWCAFISVGTATVADFCHQVLSADHSMDFYLVDCVNPGDFKFLLALSTVRFHLYCHGLMQFFFFLTSFSHFLACFC
jgi:hypothetical protein